MTPPRFITSIVACAAARPMTSPRNGKEEKMSSNFWITSRMPTTAAIATAREFFAPGEGTGDSHGAARRVRSVLGEPCHLRARDDSGEQLRDLHLEAVRQRERRALADLTRDRLGDGRMVVPEDDRP